MMMREELTCYILGVTSISSLNYASLRGNEIGTRYVSKPNHHDMTQMIVGLFESLKDPKVVTEIVGRYINLLKYSEVLKTALRCICKWPMDCLQHLSKIIVKYECYQTLDTDTNMMQRCNKKLMEGIKLEMPIGLFKEVARFPHEFLRENVDSILDGKMSIKLLVKEYTSTEERKKKVAKIEEVSGYQSIVSLRNEYPEKFTDVIVDKLPPLRQTSAKPSVENYTKIVVDDSKKDSEAGQKEIEYLELEQDIQELKRLFKYVKRSNVKKELQESIGRFEGKLEIIKPPPEDPFKFPASISKDRPTMMEEFKNIEDDIDD
jgi:hypothetical protein